MTGFLHHVAGAALPVAVGLLALAAIARVVLGTHVGDDRARTTARHYLEPLLAVGGIAAGVAILALLLAGDASALSFLAPLALAAAAGVGLWECFEAEGQVDAAPPPREPEPEPEPHPIEPARSGSLWAGPVEDPAPRTSLWSDR